VTSVSAGPPVGTRLVRGHNHNDDEENPMSGETDKAKGRMKQAAGDLSGDRELEREGEKDESAGR
jgi:uncharacterized protein YjbJ (UPF0337 family)